MRSPHLTRSPLTAPLTARLLAVAVAALLTLAAACGGEDPVAEDTPSPTVTASGTAAPSQTPTSSPSQTPGQTSTPTATPTQEPDDQIGDGDSEGDDSPATAGGGICGELSSDEVGAVLGGTVKGSALSGTGGCRFAQSDPKALAASVIDKAYSASGGMDAAKNDATAAVEGTPQDVSGIGTEAFVVTGTVFGGADFQGAGAVHVGNRLVSVTVSQQKGLSRAQVRAHVLALLRLVVAEQS